MQAPAHRGCRHVTALIVGALLVFIVLTRLAFADVLRPPAASTNTATATSTYTTTQAAPDAQLFAYRPRYRSVAYLTGILSPLVSGTFVSRVHHDATKDVPENELIVFRGSDADVALIRQLLPQVDTPMADVMAHGVVYEVERSASETSAFDLVLSLLAGEGALSLGAGASVVDGAVLSLRHASLHAVLSALSSDGRFRMLSNPRLRIRSGRSAHFSVGEEVPTLAAIAYPAGADGPVQSIKYQAAGLIFDISPTVRDDQIEVQLRQQVSDFVPTENGVNGSPTLTKREISTSVVVDDGELIMIGGLQRQRRAQGRHGLSFLPSWMGSRAVQQEDSEIILLLQVQRVRPR